MNAQILALSFALAFLLSGIAQVLKDLGQRSIDKPGWALHPSFVGTLLAGITWFTRPILDSYSSTGQKARAVAFGTLGVVTQLTVLTAFFYGAILLATSWFDSVLAQAAIVIAFLVLGTPIILPVASILIVPVTWILSVPLDMVFPLKESKKSQDIEWCKNCVHYKKSKEYEDVMDGLWAAEEMPSGDKLPCKIVAEAMDTWIEFYARERSEKTLFPNNCSKFERA